ncbi:hydrogenase assembly protein HypC [candidate division WOR_3 bacterium SM23_42]|jgi:hydrogenase expression/formation protein HypC|uniref:Hydrogenase assembly protein HypC n=1 Tax=candidate division WOR_3 bacterium SM23_42 TaxID=1703779 RepID=A0A0S8FUD9_UNCW3|nr:MAG: hydrogenase assembly protein HypC [candidate division WOR_3 bacterium SM23_42]
MCLGVVGRIDEIDGEMATAEIMGVRRRISIVLVPETKIGDYVMIHAGFAINQMDEKDARETEEMIMEVLKYS